MEFRSDMTVELAYHVGLDQDVAKAARVSTLGEGAKEDGRPVEGLINFLMRDRHGSPFEHNSMTFYIEAPIFVAREFFRHRAGWSYNEESARYKELEPSFYVPDKHRKLIQTGKPGAYSFEQGTFQHRGALMGSFQVAYREAHLQYRNMLEAGIAREVARAVLPVGTYTSFYATCNARSLMHFLSLRTTRPNSAFSSFPQREIEMVAEKMEADFAELMPATYEAFERHGRVAP
ncbi:FAD-dependent thymidylate synthase [Streptomyces sp. NPDC002698]|uniref:FAD-dependent thymidylate synthase n=1 Tax=Streptomyces sp. NPDC002698 TaxID=3364660 RepID=UPI0036B829C5